MTVKERILSLRLLEAQENQGLFMNKIGISAALVDTEKQKSAAAKTKDPGLAEEAEEIKDPMLCFQ